MTPQQTAQFELTSAVFVHISDPELRRRLAGVMPIRLEVYVPKRPTETPGACGCTEAWHITRRGLIHLQVTLINSGVTSDGASTLYVCEHVGRLLEPQ